tara:strand:- start:19632 stop:20111 length:480 start_codon:yes stop_codon:yes gene_type:complete
VKRIRDTSLGAWKQVQPAVAPLRRKIYDLLLTREDATGAEINAHFDLSGAHKRLSELKADGLIREACKRTCSVTGKEAYAWEVVPDTGFEEATEASKSRRRKSLEEMQVGFRQFVYLVSIAQKELGYVVPPELIALGKELRMKYGRNEKRETPRENETK